MMGVVLVDLVGALYTKSKVQLLKEEWEDARDSLIRARGYGVESIVSPAVNNNLKMLVMVVRCRSRSWRGWGRASFPTRPMRG